MVCCHCFDKYKQDDVDEIVASLDLQQACPGQWLNLGMGICQQSIGKSVT